MSERESRLTDEQARALWERAAQLQAAAENRPRALPAESSDLSLEQVALAAEGAGIGADYVRVAMAERQLPDGAAIDPGLWTARWLRAILREPDALDLSRTIDAAPAPTLAALKTVIMRPAFELVQEAVVGEDPLVDAVLVYRLARTKGSSFHESLDWTDVRVLLFTLRAADEGTRLNVRVPFFRRGLNLTFTGGLAGLVGAGGMSAGSAAASLPLLAGLGAAAMLPVAGAVAGGVVGVGLFRAFYRSAARDGAQHLTRLLHAVAEEAES